jgi:hypothetical protein
MKGCSQLYLQLRYLLLADVEKQRYSSVSVFWKRKSGDRGSWIQFTIFLTLVYGSRLEAKERKGKAFLPQFPVVQF